MNGLILLKQEGYSRNNLPVAAGHKIFEWMSYQSPLNPGQTYA
jgi:hypothetical protein